MIFIVNIIMRRFFVVSSKKQYTGFIKPGILFFLIIELP